MRDSHRLFAHQHIWSEYKQRTTLKFFGAISGNGAFTFVSTAFRGRVTDPVVTRLCGFFNSFTLEASSGPRKAFKCTQTSARNSHPSLFLLLRFLGTKLSPSIKWRIRPPSRESASMSSELKSSKYFTESFR